MASPPATLVAIPVLHRGWVPRLPRTVFVALLGLSVGLGGALGHIAPIDRFDWVGLLRGRSPQVVLLEGLMPPLRRPYHVLVLGIDRVPGASPDSPQRFEGRADAMVLLRVDPHTKTMTLLSIPRDTQVELPGQGIGKINAANVYGGATLARAVVTATLGGVPIDRVVRLSGNTLVELVDAVGGVEVNVPKRLRYVDRTQNLDIDLQPGIQVLNGTQAEGFARFRYDERGDIGRIARQQMLLAALQQKLDSPWVLSQLPAILHALQRNLDTDLTFDESLAIVAFAATVPRDRIAMLALPGYPANEYGASYWIADPGQLATVTAPFTATSGDSPVQNSL